MIRLDTDTRLRLTPETLQSSRRLMERRKPVLQLLKYGITGLFGSVLYFVVMVALVEAGGVQPTLSSFLAFLTTVASCYFINSYWTFNIQDISWNRFFKYTLVSLVGLLLTTSITYTGAHVLDIWYLYTQIAVVIVVPISNYLLNSLWVFAAPAADDGSDHAVE